MGKRSAKLRMTNTKRTDIRVKIMNEILFGIQVIKMYAWEKSFAKLVDRIRKWVECTIAPPYVPYNLILFIIIFNLWNDCRKEVNAIRSIAYIRATINSFAMISKVSIFLSLISYVYFGNVITARKVFIVSSFFSILHPSMIYSFPLALIYV